MPDTSILQDLRDIYRSQGIVRVPKEWFPELPSGDEIRRLGDEVITLALSESYASNRIDSTMEIIRVAINGLPPTDPECVIERRQVLTRLENFVLSHKEWDRLCSTDGILSKLVGWICSEELIAAEDINEHEIWCLYKEKLNLKPAGGSGFAAHFDNPSLQVVGLCDNFITLMIAIDDMTIDNGCLRVVRGHWSEESAGAMCVPTVTDESADPDGDGRRGAISSKYADELNWEPIECHSGDIYIFSGWIPHRSGVNATQLPRRAVFLTYNCPEDGDLREDYYRVMRIMRAKYQDLKKS